MKEATYILVKYLTITQQCVLNIFYTIND